MTTSLRRNWESVQAARLERAIGRTLRTLPMLRYRGACIICGENIHAINCAAGILELELAEHRGRIAPKEVTHFIYRKSQAKA